MQNVKLIAFDLDYTLLRTGGALSDFTKQTLLKAQERGIKLVPCSGRNLKEMAGVLSLIKCDYVVGLNGSMVYDVNQNKTLVAFLPNQEEISKKLKLALDLGLYVEVFCFGDIFTSKYCYDNMKELGVPIDLVDFFKKTRVGLDNFEDKLCEFSQIEKIHILFKDCAQKSMLLARFTDSDCFNFTSSYSNNIEIVAKGANKGEGLSRLATILGLTSEEIMAIGDGDNDVPMLKWAGISVAMQNAVQQAKQVAKIITDTNDNDGLAKAVIKYALS